MASSIAKLLSVSSPAIEKLGPDRDLLKRGQGNGQLRQDLFDMLRERNGFYAFESALHVFPSGAGDAILDLEKWNAETLWKSEYSGLATDCYCFAEDIFGVQFCLTKDTVQTFDPETAEIKPFALGIEGWAEKVVSDFNLYTGYPFAHDWQTRHGPLRPGWRLLPKTPFVLGGAFELHNLYELDCVAGMRFRASLALQIRDVPDGAPVKLRIVP